MRLAAFSLFLFALSSLADNLNDPPRRPIPGVTHSSFRSDAAQRMVGFNIYLPPQYGTSDGKRYPVIYHLAGMGDTENAETSLATILEQAIREKQTAPFILVFVNGGQTSFYSDSKDGRLPIESIFINELIPHIDKNYRTIPTREGRAIEGFSMGAFGALKFAFKYPDRFGCVVGYAAGLYDGAMMKEKLPKVIRQHFAGRPEVFDEQSPEKFLLQNRDKIKSTLPIRLVVGSKEMLLELCRRMHLFLDSNGVRADYKEIPGIGHDALRLFERDASSGFKFISDRLGSSPG